MASKKGIKKQKENQRQNQQHKHIKELKKDIKNLSGHIKKRETAVQKQLTEHLKYVQQVKQDVGETKQHYVHIPKLTLETQILIESMNKLTAVVKQLLVLFNQKISKEEGPLFERLDTIQEQNEKIAEAILVVAEMLREKQTPKAQIREFNPYMAKIGPEPEPIMEQMPTPQQKPQISPDLGKFQFLSTEQQEQREQQPQPIPQYSAPLPPFSPVPSSATQIPQEKNPSRKRFLF